MKRIKKNLALLFLILFVAAFLRFYQLGANPPSLDWDEASLGYNAYSILKTGADEYGEKLPVAIRSFNDYKPAAYVYLAIPSIYLFGLNEFSVRFTSAFIGVLTVLLTYLLVKELLSRDSEFKHGEKIALLSSFLLAISPWHLQFSRGAFEANIGVFFFCLGVYLFLKGLKNGGFLILALISFALTLYSYHSFRLITPIFLLSSFIYFREALFLKKKNIFIGLIFAFIISVPLLLSLVTNLSRFSSVTIFNSSGILDNSVKELAIDKQRGDFIGQIVHNRRTVFLQTALKGYLDHFDFNFLFVRGDSVARHHAYSFGMLYLAELPFLLFGIYRAFFLKLRTKFTLFLWFFLGPVAAAISTGTPHAIRSIAILPTFQIFTAIGIYYFINLIPNNSKKLYASVFVSLCFFVNVLFYLNLYYISTPKLTSQAWQYGYKQVFDYAKKNEFKYDKIIVTYKYDQPYIFYLFFNKIDPSWYQKNWDYKGDGVIERMNRKIGKYEFKNIESADLGQGKTLIIGAPNEASGSRVLKDIKFLDGTVAFRISES